MAKVRTRGDVPVRSIVQPLTSQTYKPNWIPVRPGAQDHENVPSRRSDGRYFRDGRVEEVQR